MRLSSLLISLLGLLLEGIFAQQAPDPGTNGTGPISQYKSRPEIYAPFLNVTILDENAVTPGYIFMAPYQTAQAGIYIYDNLGNLVYSGYGQTGGGPSHNFHVSNIGGQDRLCYFTGAQGEGYGRGFVTIMNDRLQGISTVRAQAGLAALDEHEFHVVDNGTAALVTNYQPMQTDLSAYNVTSSQGWIMNCHFQKIDIATNDLLFDWNAFDFVDLSESYVEANQSEVSGTGLTPAAAWDYFHINSVDQAENGDFIVSSRHTSTIYRVSGQDGHIVWRLGGKLSDFNFTVGVNFSYQHDARIRSENSSTMILSLFDNAANGYAVQSSRYSSGMILKLDFTTTPYNVTLLSQFIPPNHFTSNSQGNVQLLPAQDNSTRSDWASANAFIGWGSQAWVTEYGPGNPGPIVQQAFFATSGSMSYRAYKQNFTTNPPDFPALYTYCETNTSSSNTSFYMSWNGATRVTDWRIYGKTYANESWTEIGIAQKNGFETHFTARGYWVYGMVEALEYGTSLKNSTSSYGGVKTFVPSAVLTASCGASGCLESDGSFTDLDDQSSASANATVTPSPHAPPSATSSSAAEANIINLRGGTANIGLLSLLFGAFIGFV